MSRYKAYPEYKDSGLQWMGVIPKHWDVVYSKAVFQERNEKASIEAEQLTASQKYGILPQKLFMEIEQQRVVQVFKGQEILKRVEKNDFVISMRSFQGGIEFSPYSGSISSAYVPLFARAEVSNGFFKYFLKSEPYIQALQSTTNLVRDGQALRYANFVQVPLPRFPVNEQEQIANFLDHETAKIDTLIAKQQELIKLLKEKRLAVIGHAVTKGINSESVLRDSGIDWIGEIPCDWEMWKVNHACPYVASGTTPKSDSDIYYGGETLWVTTGELREQLILDTQKKVTSKALVDMPTLRLHPEGSVAIAMYGATIGRLGIFGKAATTNQACCVMPPSKILQNKYLFYWLFANRQEIINLSAGGGQPNVNQEKIASLKISAPSYDKQIEIANFLDRETEKIDCLILKQQKAILLMEERRTALISAAVTGKIDVRDWQPPVSEAQAA